MFCSWYALALPLSQACALGRLNFSVWPICKLLKASRVNFSAIFVTYLLIYLAEKKNCRIFAVGIWLCWRINADSLSCIRLSYLLISGAKLDVFRQLPKKNR